MITHATAETPAARARPATVTVAFGLQLGVVAALLAVGVLNVVEAVVYDGLIDRAAELTRADPEEVSAERAFNVGWAATVGVLTVVLLVLFAATAFPARSGRNVARVLTCVGAGIPIVCCCAFGGMAALAIPMVAMEDPDQLAADPYLPEDTPFYESLYDLQSTGAAAWLSVVLPALVVLVGLASVAIAVLLLVPPSNRYYRPPVGPPVTPGYPFAYPVPPGFLLVPIGPAVPGAPIPGPVAPPHPAPPPAVPTDPASGTPPHPPATPPEPPPSEPPSPEPPPSERLGPGLRD